NAIHSVVSPCGSARNRIRGSRENSSYTSHACRRDNTSSWVIAGLVNRRRSDICETRQKPSSASCASIQCFAVKCFECRAHDAASQTLTSSIFISFGAALPERPRRRHPRLRRGRCLRLRHSPVLLPASQRVEGGRGTPSLPDCATYPIQMRPRASV